MHELDYSLLKALKASFDSFSTVREACAVLDTFYSVSERPRIKETYELCKEKILKVLERSCVLFLFLSSFLLLLLLLLLFLCCCLDVKVAAVIFVNNFDFDLEKPTLIIIFLC